MEGRCRRCGEKLSLLQRLQGQDFCSPEHKAEFQREQEEMALARLQQTASNLKKPEAKSVSKTGLREVSSISQSAIELKRETTPPMARFLEFWHTTTILPPLPPELREEDLTVHPKVPGAKRHETSAFRQALTQLPLSVKVARGDVNTILSPRTSSILVTPAPSVAAWTVALEPFPWAAKAMILDQGPPEAGLVQITSLRARVYEPAVRWLEPSDVDLAIPAPRASASCLTGWSSPSLAAPIRPMSLAALPRLCDWHGGVRGSEGHIATVVPPAIEGHGGQRPTSSRLAPDFAGTIAARVRFGYRRPRRVRIQAAAEDVFAAPVIRDASLSISSPLLAWPASPARRLTAGAAKAPARPLPHFAAVPVPVRPIGYGYTPDLTPIAITANWLAANVPLPVAPADAQRVTAPNPGLAAEFTVPVPSHPAAGTRLDCSASNWAIPPVAPSVGMSWRISANTALVPAGPEQHGDFAPAPRVASRLTSMRASVPSMRRRIRMEVRLEPPKPAPWFEPLTCAFGGDPYGSR